MKQSIQTPIIEQAVTAKLTAATFKPDNGLGGLFETFKQEQTLANNLDSIEALLLVADPRLHIEAEQVSEFLFTFLLEYWSHSIQCFTVWRQLISKLSLAPALTPLPEVLTQTYQDAFTQAPCLVQTIPSLYLLTRAYGDFSDRFRQLTGSEWCPLNFSQLEVLLMSLIDESILLSLDQLLDHLWTKIPSFRELVEEQFWQRYEQYEPGFSTQCADWSVSFTHKVIGITFLH